MKYEVGDTVRITDRHVDKNRMRTEGGLYVNDIMISLAGKIATIEEVYHGDYYTLDISSYYYDEYMLEPVPDINIDGWEKLL